MNNKFEKFLNFLREYFYIKKNIKDDIDTSMYKIISYPLDRNGSIGAFLFNINNIYKAYLIFTINDLFDGKYRSVTVPSAIISFYINNIYYHNAIDLYSDLSRLIIIKYKLSAIDRELIASLSRENNDSMIKFTTDKSLYSAVGDDILFSKSALNKLGFTGEKKDRLLYIKQLPVESEDGQ